jgi:hypothetical protein
MSLQEVLRVQDLLQRLLRLQRLRLQRLRHLLLHRLLMQI